MMNKSRLVTVSCTLACFAVGAVFVSPALAQHEEHQGGHGHNIKGGSLALHQLMEASGQKMEKMNMSGDTDKDFATMMAEHHATAIKMADIEIKYGKVAALKALAKKMKAQQTKEREQLLAHAKMKH